MNLEIQIITLVVSFVYGIFLSLFIRVNYKIIYNEKLTIKIIGTSLVVLNSGLLYFFIFKKINYADFHIYCLLVLTLGFCMGNFIVKRYKR